MSLRETLQKRPAVAVGLATTMLVLAIGLLIWNFSSIGVPNTQSFYTTGEDSADAALAGLYMDDADQAPPLEKDGKPAYGAVVYTTDGGKTRGVAWITKFTPEVIESLKNAADAEERHAILKKANPDQTLVKIPGKGSWVSPLSAEGSRVVTLPELANIKIIQPGR